MRNIVITDRDVEILKTISRIGFLTETQICALFYSKSNDFTLDLKRARGSLSKRLYQLVHNGYLAKSTIPTSGKVNRVAYMLGPNGAEVLKNPRELESRQDPRWLERRANGLLIRSRHDIVTTNFLVNLIMLSRLLPAFHLIEWIPDRDCRFYIPQRDKKLVVNPDLYLSIRNGSADGLTLFLEIDNDTLDKKALRIKITRFFQYYSSRKFKRDLETDRFPRICILVPSQARLEVVKTAIVNAKEFYPGGSSDNVSRMPFWLTTFDQVEINSLDNGLVSKKALEPIWVNEAGKPFPSPLLP